VNVKHAQPIPYPTALTFGKGMAALGVAALVVYVVATHYTFGIHTSSRPSLRAGVMSSVSDAEISFQISYFAN
jgi:hypothetical protein